jgi:hypothetical protein
MRTSGPLQLIAAAAEALDDEDLDEATDAALAAQVRGLWVAICRLQAQLSRRVAVFDERGAAARDGARSVRDWLRHRLRLDAVEAGRQATVAATLAVRPATTAAYLRGDLSLDHVAAIDEAGWILGDEAMTRGVERILLDHARRESPGRLRRLTRRLRERGDPRSGLEAFRRVRTHRFLDVIRAATGAITLRGQLDAGDGELLLAALAAQGVPGGPAGAGTTPALGGGEFEVSGAAAGTPEQLRADALVSLCRTVLRTDLLDAGRGRGDRPRVVVTVPLETLRSAGWPPEPLDRRFGSAAPDGGPGAGPRDGPVAEEAQLGSGEPVSAATARRLACDARVLPAVLGGEREVLDIGAETETVTQGLRRAAELRDQGCRFPGCDRPTAECETHYVTHWARSGLSIVDNVVLLCPHHHVLVHEGGWQVSRDPYTGEVRARRPDGTRLDAVSPPPNGI